MARVACRCSGAGAPPRQRLPSRRVAARRRPAGGMHPARIWNPASALPPRSYRALARLSLRNLRDAGDGVLRVPGRLRSIPCRQLLEEALARVRPCLALGEGRRARPGLARLARISRAPLRHPRKSRHSDRRGGNPGPWSLRRPRRGVRLAVACRVAGRKAGAGRGGGAGRCAGLSGGRRLERPMAAVRTAAVRSSAELLGQLVQELAVLIRSELEVSRLQHAVERRRRAYEVAALAGGAAAALLGVAAASWSAVHALGSLFSPSFAALIVAGGWGIVAAL